MRSTILAVLLSFLAVTIAACGASGSSEEPCTPTLLLEGGLLPADQGWTELGCVVGDPASTDGTQLTVDTLAVAGCSEPTSPQRLYARDVGLLPGTAMAIEWQMQVIDADPHNLYDAGVAFMPSLTGTFGIGDERDQMIYFDDGAIGWADDSASYAVDTTAAARLYRLEVDADGSGRVLVDGALALSRTGLQLGGTIAIGDQTNDPGVDGAFVLDFIRIGCP